MASWWASWICSWIARFNWVYLKAISTRCADWLIEFCVQASKDAVFFLAFIGATVAIAKVVVITDLPYCWVSFSVPALVCTLGCAFSPYWAIWKDFSHTINTSIVSVWICVITLFCSLGVSVSTHFTDPRREMILIILFKTYWRVVPIPWAWRIRIHQGWPLLVCLLKGWRSNEKFLDIYLPGNSSKLFKKFELSLCQLKIICYNNCSAYEAIRAWINTRSEFCCMHTYFCLWIESVPANTYSYSSPSIVCERIGVNSSSLIKFDWLKLYQNIWFINVKLKQSLELWVVKSN